MDAYLSPDGLRAGLVLLFAIAQAVMAYWPEMMRRPDTIASRSAALRNPVVPIEWAFAIWGPIFLGCLAFGIWQALPEQLDDPWLRRIGWAAAATFALNAVWEFHVPRRTIDGVSLAIILAELALLLWIVLTMAGWAAAGWQEFWLVQAPLQLLAGWVTAAAAVNAASTLQAGGQRPGTVLSVALVLAAAALGAAVAAWTGAWVYAVALAWALFGVVVANLARERNLAVAGVAGACLPLLLLALSL